MLFFIAVLQIFKHYWVEEHIRKNVQEMNEKLISNWNNNIKNEDEIYHLGDFALGRKEDAFDIANKLNGIKYIVRGNHDKWSTKMYEEMGFTVLKNAPIKLNEYKLLLSHIPVPDKQIPNGYINIHGHIHNNRLYECIEKYDPKLYSIDKHLNISCDITEFKPISIEKIVKKLK